ncbi:MAG TPA: tetratricopeptide repeat protein [bacterium]
MIKKQQKSSPAETIWNYVGIFILFICIVAVYSMFLHREFTYDDTIMIVRQDAPKSINDIVRYFKEQYYPELPYYRPVTKISFLIQKAIHGNNPVPFHLFNAIVIGLAAVIVYTMLRLPAFDVPKIPALFAATIFGLHPVVSASVYPAWGRDSLLSGFLIIATVYAFLRTGKFWYTTAIVLGTLALLSKEAAVVLLSIFALADILKLSEDSPGTDILKWLTRYLPIIAIYIGYFAVRHSLFKGRELEVTVFDHPTLPLLTPVYALQSILAPTWELIYEPRSWSIWFSLPRMIVTGVAIFLVAFVSVKQWSSIKRPVLFWIGWFALCILPTANILEQETKYAERFLFPAILGIIAIVFIVLKTYRNKTEFRWIAVPVGSILIIACMIITVYRHIFYKNNLVFYSQWLKFNPEYYLPNHAMGTVLYEQGRGAEAAKYYRKAIQIKPDWPDSYLNLGVIYMDQQNYDEATKCMLEYIKLKPNSAKACYSLGVALTRQEKYNDALVYYARALEIDPTYAEAHHNMGVIYHLQDQLEKAASHYRAALKIDPGKQNTLHYLRMIENKGSQVTPK